MELPNFTRCEIVISDTCLELNELISCTQARYPKRLKLELKFMRTNKGLDAYFKIRDMETPVYTTLNIMTIPWEQTSEVAKSLLAALENTED